MLFNTLHQQFSTIANHNKSLGRANQPSCFESLESLSRGADHLLPAYLTVGLGGYFSEDRMGTGYHREK